MPEPFAVQARCWSKQDGKEPRFPQLWSPNVTTCFVHRASFFISGYIPKDTVEYLPTLRLFFEGGVSNDYRLRGDLVEFRTNEGPWRLLDESDLATHFRFETEVARWLRRHFLETNPHRSMAR